jgi:transcription antitermination protein NusB
MGKRRDSREAAVQFLFQRDLHTPEHQIGVDDFWSLRPAPENVKKFATELITGVLAHQAAIDEQIKKFLKNYDLHRVAAVDRNVLRVAVFEMLFCPDIPPVISINEAIEVAKKFGAQDSGKFVNGVLDRIRSELPRPARQPANPHEQTIPGQKDNS